MIKDNPAVNQVALLDKDTLEIASLFDLKKQELPNCIACFEKSISGESRLSSIVAGTSGKQGLVAVGTS